jgi:surface polysaccharide O-acyltransferase-like enzyme
MSRQIQENRHSGIELTRVIAILGVVALHGFGMCGIRGKAAAWSYFVLKEVYRWFMPFFFGIAGYYWGKKLRDGKDLLNVSFVYGRRIGTLWLFWTAFFILMPSDLDIIFKKGIIAFVKEPFWQLQSLITDPVTLIFVGSELHLWFLVALLCALFISTALLKLNKERWLIWIGFILYGFGLLAGSWASTPLGFNIHFYTRNGPFFSLIFFAAGWHWSAKDKKLTLRGSIALVLIGLITSFLEDYLIWTKFGVSLSKNPYGLGTLPFGLGAISLVLLMPDMGRNCKLALLGKYMFGVYAIHMLFLNWLQSLGILHDYVSLLPLILLTFVVSTISIYFIRKFPSISRYVN